MLLTKEIDGIKKIINESKESYLFPVIEPDKSSYYIDYSDSKHQEDTIMDYSSEFLDFKKNLMALWQDDCKKSFSKDVLSSIMQVKDDEESVVEAVTLYNYMM